MCACYAPGTSDFLWRLPATGNKLAALGGFDALAKLKKLTVEGNQLASLAGLGALPSLTELSAVRTRDTLLHCLLLLPSCCCLVATAGGAAPGSLTALRVRCLTDAEQQPDR